MLEAYLWVSTIDLRNNGLLPSTSIFFLELKDKKVSRVMSIYKLRQAYACMHACMHGIHALA